MSLSEMVAQKACQLASLAGFLPSRRAVRLRDGLAARPGQGTIARSARAGPVYRQSYLDGRSRNDPVCAPISVQTQIGDCDGRRKVARIAPRTRRGELVRAAARSRELSAGRNRLQRLLAAEKERFPARLRVRRRSGR